MYHDWKQWYLGKYSFLFKIDVLIHLSQETGMRQNVYLKYHIIYFISPVFDINLRNISYEVQHHSL